MKSLLTFINVLLPLPGSEEFIATALKWLQRQLFCCLPDEQPGLNTPAVLDEAGL